MNFLREYDIRGIADTDLTNPLCWAIGRCLAEQSIERGERRAFIGQDARVSSLRILSALAAGLRAGGMELRFLKTCPTPLLYFAALNPMKDFSAKSGFMVTGSHNPGEYNGIKMVVAGESLFGDRIQKMRASIEKYLKEAPAHINLEKDFIDREDDYISFVKQNIRLKKKLRVVVDGGNGSAGPLGVKTYEALGCEVIPLFIEPDGRFPNHHPDPTVPKNLMHLQKKVIEVSADLGIAFDGDGDRIGAVSSSGKILFGDHLVLYYARDILKEVPGATIISEVKSSQLLYDTLEKWGAKAIMWKTGHSLMKAKLKETHGALAGEMSGHMFFSHRFFGFDDAIYSGARLMEGLSLRDESLDDFLEQFPKFINTPEIRIDYPDNKKFVLVEKFISLAKEKYGAAVNDIDGARVKIRDGWGLIRASNTQPVLVMRFEASSQESLDSIRHEFFQLLQKIDPTIEKSM